MLLHGNERKSLNQRYIAFAVLFREKSVDFSAFYFVCVLAVHISIMTNHEQFVTPDEIIATRMFFLFLNIICAFFTYFN